MSQIRNYRDLDVWQRAMDLVTHCYQLSAEFPRTEDFALRLQLRRAVVSIPANIAEGQGRTGINEYAHHLSIAHGSLMEVETLLHVALRLRYIGEEAAEPIFSESEDVARMLRGLMTALRQRARLQKETAAVER